MNRGIRILSVEGRSEQILLAALAASKICGAYLIRVRFRFRVRVRFRFRLGLGLG